MYLNGVIPIHKIGIHFSVFHENLHGMNQFFNEQENLQQ